MNTNDTLTAFTPIVGLQPRLIILGSMPGIASLDADRYYAHPRNAFWPIIETVFDSTLGNYEEKTMFLVTHGIALWDVLKHCERKGSLDSNIRQDSMVCNDFVTFFKQWQTIETVVFNGKTAEKLFTRHVLKSIEDYEKLKLVAMPSTSPAMAALNLGEKTQLWRKALTDF